MYKSGCTKTLKTTPITTMYNTYALGTVIHCMFGILLWLLRSLKQPCLWN